MAAEELGLGRGVAAPGYGASAIYWIDAKILDTLKPKD
jgi:hypothetical protein